MCPVDPAHGAMNFIQGGARQYCPDQSHDGVWTGTAKCPPTRKFWPQGWQSFQLAVTAYNEDRTAVVELPELDISGIGEFNA